MAMQVRRVNQSKTSTFSLPLSLIELFEKFEWARLLHRVQECPSIVTGEVVTLSMAVHTRPDRVPTLRPLTR